MLQSARASQGWERMHERGCNIPAELVRNGHTSAIGVVDEAQPAHVSAARKARQGREREDALVQILPAHVHQPGVKIAHVHIERVLDLAGLLERADRKACALVGGESLVPLDVAAAVP